MNPTQHPSRSRRRDFAVAAVCGAFVAAMVGAAYAAVPLYTWFCRTTGFGGTPVLAHGGPVQVLDRKVTVRFDANVASGLPWRFEPEQVSIDVRIGEVVTVYYRAENDSARETVGQAAYNVTPSTVGAYFAKINCFCFTEQRLKPHERRDMAVVFYVDPALIGDAEENDLNTITLSYTMYPVQQPEKPVVENTRPAGPGRI
ncbi:MAG TPA: cytochrome c oxidase assembly protein [Xanthobacteraceae bacterium]|jgi:cytochrome c oxidase assembly protein subunit 11|nr:cytochrome c oxidase assembly protein [Xanthobacteraceae bacterium]